jgi:hypothetical protein
LNKKHTRARYISEEGYGDSSEASASEETEDDHENRKSLYETQVQKREHTSSRKYQSESDDDSVATISSEDVSNDERESSGSPKRRIPSSKQPKLTCNTSSSYLNAQYLEAVKISRPNASSSLPNIRSSLNSSSQSVNIQLSKIPSKIDKRQSKPQGPSPPSSNFGAIAKVSQGSKAVTLSEAREELRRGIRNAREERLREKKKQMDSFESPRESNTSLNTSTSTLSTSQESLTSINSSYLERRIPKPGSVKVDGSLGDKTAKMEAMRAAYGMGVPVAVKKPLPPQQFPPQQGGRLLREIPRLRTDDMGMMRNSLPDR